MAYFIALFCGANWRLMLGLGAVPSILQFFLILCMPESPRYLMKMEKEAEAIVVMKKIIDVSTPQGIDTYHRELGQLQEAVHNQEKLGMVDQIKELFTKYH